MTLDELIELEKRATPEPWETNWDGTLGIVEIKNRGKIPDRVEIFIQRSGYGNIPPEGKLLAELRNLAPELLALWREVKSQAYPDANESYRIYQALDALESKAKAISEGAWEVSEGAWEMS